MKKIISSILVGAMLLCSFASGLVFADEPATNIPTTIAEKTSEGLAASQAQKNGVPITKKALNFLKPALTAALLISVLALMADALFPIYPYLFPLTEARAQEWCKGLTDIDDGLISNSCQRKWGYWNCFKCNKDRTVTNFVRIGDKDYFQQS